VLCKQCIPEGSLSQSVTVEMTVAPHIVVDSEGNMVENVPGYGKATSKAFDMSARSKKRSPLRAVQRVEWRSDRKQWERGVWLYDERDDVYCETWFELETGHVTYGPKRERLSEHRHQ